MIKYIQKMKYINIGLLLTICSVILFNGCSLVGYGIGLEYDSHTAKAAGTKPITFEELSEGQRVKIELCVDDVIDGTYLGVREIGDNPLFDFINKMRIFAYHTT